MSADFHRRERASVSFIPTGEDDFLAESGGSASVSSSQHGSRFPGLTAALSGSFTRRHRPSTASDDGTGSAASSTAPSLGKLEPKGSFVGSITRKGLDIPMNDREVVNTVAFPSTVAKRIPRWQRRFQSDVFIVQCYVNLYLDPPKPLKAPEPHLGDSSTPNASRGRKASRGGSPTAKRRSVFGARRASSKVDDLGLGSTSDGPEVPVEVGRQTPRGPFPVRIPLSASPREALQQIVTFLSQVQLQDIKSYDNALAASQALAQSHQLTLSGGDSPPSRPRSRQRSAGTPSVGSVSGRSGTPVDADRMAMLSSALSLFNLGKDGFPQPIPTSLYDLDPIDIDGMTLRRCDALGHVDKNLPGFHMQAPSLRTQLIPNSAEVSCAVAFYVSLAPDPEVYRQRLREANLARSEEEKVQFAQTVEKSLGAAERIESEQKWNELELYRNSLERDRALRKELHLPSASFEVRQWRREALLDAKKKEQEGAEQKRIEMENELAQFYLDQTKRLIYVELELTEGHEKCAAAVRAEETNERQELNEAFAIRAHRILGAEKAKREMKTIGASVDHWVEQQTKHHW